ncbi:hypothetical protein EPO44_17615, partial [bacterium]
MNLKKTLLMMLLGVSGLALLYSDAWAWQVKINGTATNSNDGAFAATVDGAGNVVAAGFTENIGTGSDFTVIKFDGVSGAELWR